MKINLIKREFEEGKIDKWQYINQMYEQHELLFDYAELIKSTNISAIEIIDGDVIMTFRDSGVKFMCTKNDKRLAPFDTLNFGTYEHDEMNMQYRLLNNAKVIFDIGGNYGWYAMHVAKQFPHSKVYSFEPIPHTFNKLNENIKLNAIKNIKTLNFGLSDKIGSFSFYYDPELSVNASLAKMSESKTVTEVQCNVECLDDFVTTNKIKVDFIKCDVEGAELMAFRGAMKTIADQKPIVFSEMLRKWTSKFNYHPNDIILFFSELEYQCFTQAHGRLVPFNLVDENTLETNYFFLNKHKHASLIREFSN